MRLGLYARVSTQEQQTLALQREAMVPYAAQRGGAIVLTIEEISSGAHERRQREALMQAARRRAIDAIVVWRLDRWGRSLADLIGTLHGRATPHGRQPQQSGDCQARGYQPGLGAAMPCSNGGMTAVGAPRAIAAITKRWR
jgi:hypothetical protein